MKIKNIFVFMLIVLPFSFFAQAESFVAGSWNHGSVIDDFDDTKSFWASTTNDEHKLSVFCIRRERYENEVLGVYPTAMIVIGFSEFISDGVKDVKYRIDKLSPVETLGSTIGSDKIRVSNVRDNYPMLRAMLLGNKVVIKAEGDRFGGPYVAKFDLNGITKATAGIRKMCKVAAK